MSLSLAKLTLTGLSQSQIANYVMIRFRWVACQIDYLCELPNDRARREALESLPPDLNSTYQRILQRLIANNPYRQSIAQRTLMWLLYSNGRLSSSELCQAISVNLGDDDLDEESIPSEEEVLKCCSSLIRLSSTGFELAHFTVREFLIQIDPNQMPELSPFFMEGASSRLELAKICLTYLNFIPFRKGKVDNADEWDRLHQQYTLKLHAVDFWKDYWNSRWTEKDSQSLIIDIFGSKELGSFQSLVQDYFWVSFRGEGDEQNSASDTARWFIDISFSLTTLSPLHFAAMMREDNVVEWLLENGSSVDQTSEFGQPLYLAVLGPSTRWVILKHYGHGISWLPSIPPPDERSSLAESSKEAILVHNPRSTRKRTSRVIQLLCQTKTSNIDDSGIFRSSATQLAAEMTPDTLSVLLEAGAPIDSRTLKTLIQAMEERPYHLSKHIRGIIKAIADTEPTNEIGTLFAQLSLMAGVVIGEITTADQAPNVPWLRLLNGNAQEFRVALRRAVEYSHVEAAKTLLACYPFEINEPFDIERYTDKGTTILHVAAACSSPAMIECLLDAGADPLQTSADGRSALHFCSYDQTGLNAQHLLNRGLSITAKDKKNWSLWHYAAAESNVKLIETLVDLDPDTQGSLSQKVRGGLTPLHLLGELIPKVPEIPSLRNKRLPFKELQQQCIRVLDSLLQHGADVHAKSDLGSSIIQFWFRTGFFFSAGVEVLIERGLDPCNTMDNGWTVIHSMGTPMYLFGFEDMKQCFKSLPMRKLLETADKDGSLPIHNLCRSYDTLFIPLYNELVIHGADPTVLDRSGCSCLEITYNTIQPKLNLPNPPWSSLLDASRFIINIIESYPEEDRASLLKINSRLFDFASRLDDEWFFTSLIKYGFDIDLRDPEFDSGRSGLEMACIDGVDVDIVKMLLSISKNTNGVHSSGFGLLHFVCFRNLAKDDVRVLELLLAHGLDVNLRTSKEETALLLAAEMGKTAHAEVLLQNGIDSNATSKGLSAAMVAAHHGQLAVLKLLLEHDPDTASHKAPATIDLMFGGALDDELDLLHIASNNGQTNVVEYLITSKIIPDVNRRSKEGVSSLQFAVMANHVDVIKLLLTHGANVDSLESEVTKVGPSLHWAAAKGYLDVIDILCGANCNADARDSDGRTADLVAMMRGHKEAATKIQEYIQRKGKMCSH
jgi:ankyrin repeat protein